MIAKYLLKFCSTEVKIMITRMKERPEDFKHGSTWRRLVEGVDKNNYPYTWAERIVIHTQWQQLEKDTARRQLLARILHETVDPTPEESIEDGMSSYVNKVNYMQRAQNAHAAHLQAHVAAMQGQSSLTNISNYPSGFSDPRQLYNNAIQGRPL
jgi:hypothetical protein